MIIDALKRLKLPEWSIALPAGLAIASGGAAHAQMVTKPSVSRPSATFTISEQASAGVISGPVLSMSHSREIHFALFDFDSASSYWHFEISNSRKPPGTNTEVTTLSYRGFDWVDYETASPIDGRRRGYEFMLVGCPQPPDTDDFEESCGIIDITVVVTDVAEIETIEGTVEVDGTLGVGDTLQLDTSKVSDVEGINNMITRWAAGSCPDGKGLGRWPNVTRTLGRAQSYVVQQTEEGQAISAWAQYSADSGGTKWVCKNVGRIEPAPVENEAPIPVNYNIDYTVAEGTGPSSLPSRLSMFDRDSDVIDYELDTDNSQAGRTIRSIFSVENREVADDVNFQPARSDTVQRMRINLSRTLDYETTPTIEDPFRGYRFDVEGCDPHGACSPPVTVTVWVEDKAEVDTMSGLARISGTSAVGSSLTADFSSLADAEGGVDNLRDGAGRVEWRHGACTADRGTGHGRAAYPSAGSTSTRCRTPTKAR